MGTLIFGIKKCRWFWGLVISLHVIVFLLIAITYSTLIRQEAPVTLGTNHIEVIRQLDVVEINCKRKVTITSGFQGQISRRITNLKTGEIFDFPGIDTRHEENSTIRSTSILLPGSVKPGKYQLQVIVNWKPFFSLGYHSTKLPEETFEIE